MSEHTPASRSTSGYAKKIEQLIEQRDSLRAVNAELLAALEKISAIENKMYGADWKEIEEARDIADAAIASARKQENPHG